MKGWNWLTTGEAAKQLGVSEQAVRRYVRSGILAGQREGQRIKVSQRAVLALVELLARARGAHRSAPPPPPRRAEERLAGEDDQAPPQLAGCIGCAGFVDQIDEEKWAKFGEDDGPARNGFNGKADNSGGINRLD